LVSYLLLVLNSPKKNPNNNTNNTNDGKKLTEIDEDDESIEIEKKSPEQIRHSNIARIQVSTGFVLLLHINYYFYYYIVNHEL
jgi:hypothetical protein